jgi:hypothetical protein
VTADPSHKSNSLNIKVDDVHSVNAKVIVEL